MHKLKDTSEPKPSTEQRETLVIDKAATKAARLVYLDGIRGYLLVMMFLAHYSFTQYTPLYRLHHGNYSAVFDGEFFVLISGFVCALAYYGAYTATGFNGCLRKVLARLKWVYIYQVTVSILAIILFAAAFPINLDNSYVFDEETPLYLQFLKTFTFASMPKYLDILVLYLVLMLFIPVAFLLLKQASHLYYFTIIIILWLNAETGLYGLVSIYLNNAFPHAHEYANWRGSFNPLSYCLIFYIGFYVAYIYKQSADNPERKTLLPPRRWLYLISVLVAGSFALLEIFHSQLQVPIWIYDPTRTEISIIGLFSTFSIAYATYFLIASKHLGKIESMISAVVKAFFSNKYLVLIGRNSLFVYSIHVLLVFFTSYIIKISHAATNLYSTLLFVAMIALLYFITRWKNTQFPALP